MTGYIKLHRQILESDIWRCDLWTQRVWQYFLLSAAHAADSKWKQLPAGSLQVKFSQVVKDTYFIEKTEMRKLTRSKFNNVLKYLAEKKMIQYQQRHGKDVFITIVKWDRYQHVSSATMEVQNTKETLVHDRKIVTKINSGRLLDLWGRDCLPRTPHYSQQEMALHTLHAEYGYSEEQIELLIKRVQQHKDDGLNFIWKSGPIRLIKTINKTGQLAAEYVERFEGFHNHTIKENTNGTARKRVENGHRSIEKWLHESTDA